MAPDHDLNGFRDHGQPGRNLADMHLATHGMGPEARHAPWLTVDRASGQAEAPDDPRGLPAAAQLRFRSAGRIDAGDSNIEWPAVTG